MSLRRLLILGQIVGASVVFVALVGIAVTR